MSSWAKVRRRKCYAIFAINFTNNQSRSRDGTRLRSILSLCSALNSNRRNYQAELKGWVLYLEGSTDLSILQAFAHTLGHPAAAVLARPFVHYLTTNLPNRARDHFFGLQEAKPDLVGFALFDRIDKPLASGTPLTETLWQKREIENYLCSESVLLAYAKQGQVQGNLNSDIHHPLKTRLDLLGAARPAKKHRLTCIGFGRAGWPRFRFRN